MVTSPKPLWPALRDFLQIPDGLTGRGVRIAIVDGTFTGHPDVTGTAARATYHVLAAAPDPKPVPLEPVPGPWSDSAQHGTWAAAAAAGSGALSGGRYAGVAPEAELFLIAGHLRGATPDAQARNEVALRWLRAHAKELGIRGVVPATSGGSFGTGLLPWQLDPVRVLCEALVDDGLLVVAGTGNQSDVTCDVTQAQAPSVFAAGGVALPAEGTGDWSDALPYACSRGTLFDGKWVPELLAPAENLVLPLLGDAQARERVYDGPDYGLVPDGYIRTNGTSFAGPAVLGAAACVWQAHQDWTAAQVRAALVATARHRPQWKSLRVGLISVAAAVAAAPALHVTGHSHALGVRASPYQRYDAWRRQSAGARVRAAGDLSDSDPDAAAEAILSLLPDQTLALDESNMTALEELLRNVLLAGAASRSLSAALLCVLAARPEQLSTAHLTAGLEHQDARVRGAALHALDYAPGHWDACAPLIARAFTDESLDLRVAAMKLAGKLADPRWVPAVVEGLEEDVALRRLANYVARRNALTAITGTTIDEQPPWRPGQSPGDPKRWAARQRVAEAWRATLE